MRHSKDRSVSWPQRAMKIMTALAFVAGVFLFAYLLKRYHPRDVLLAVAAAGWGVLYISAYRFVSIATDAAGWRELFPGRKPQAWLLVVLRWIGEAVNTLIPVAQVGGGVVRARLLGRAEGNYVPASAATAVDFTVGVFAQVVYTILGMALFFHATRPQTRALQNGMLAATVFMFAALAVLYAVQRGGMFHKLATGFQTALAGNMSSMTRHFKSGAEALDTAVTELYASPGALARCAAWRVSGSLLRTAEAWIAMHFLGTPVSWGEALILESLSSAVRSAVFFVPAGVGAQEGGLLLIGSALGIAPASCLALSLVKRAREIIVGVPGLATWGVLERMKIRSAG